MIEGRNDRMVAAPGVGAKRRRKRLLHERYHLFASLVSRPLVYLLTAAQSAETAESDSAESQEQEGTGFRSRRGTEQLEGMLLTIVAPG